MNILSLDCFPRYAPSSALLASSLEHFSGAIREDKLMIDYKYSMNIKFSKASKMQRKNSSG
ncbi:hypothetical protein HMPREF3038_02108 [Akkermansia sp. KLE1797]|nr:hypothetical protein HMPREF3038_02108 [Akkermansia sp. KLE1797]